jgi:hypothetical protein
VPWLPVRRAVLRRSMLRLAVRRLATRRLPVWRLAMRRSALWWAPRVRRLTIGLLRVGGLLAVRWLLAIGRLPVRRLARIRTAGIRLLGTGPLLAAVRVPVVPCHTEMLGLVATSRSGLTRFSY